MVSGLVVSVFLFFFWGGGVVFRVEVTGWSTSVCLRLRNMFHLQNKRILAGDPGTLSRAAVIWGLGFRVQGLGFRV